MKISTVITNLLIVIAIVITIIKILLGRTAFVSKKENSLEKHSFLKIFKSFCHNIKTPDKLKT